MATDMPTKGVKAHYVLELVSCKMIFFLRKLVGIGNSYSPWYWNLKINNTLRYFFFFKYIHYKWGSRPGSGSNVLL